eukprot:6051328-Lingulodinium_polyedra.AAC.1
MMRSNRRFAAAVARKPNAHALHARAIGPVRAWTPRACDLRTVAAAQRQFYRIIVQRMQIAAQVYAQIDVSSPRGSQTARSQTPCARQETGAR